MRPLVIIRPQPAAKQSAARAAAMGMNVIVAPLFDITPVLWQLPAPLSHDALVIGSSNALRHIGPALSSLIHLPLYAVGSVSGDLARDMGFANVISGEGGLQLLAPRIAADGRRQILRLVGAEHLPLALPDNVFVDSRIVYRVDTLPMPPALAAQLAQPVVVLLHSADAAAHFASLVSRREHITIAALAPRIAQAAGKGWAAVHVAKAPHEQALLALAQLLCKTTLQ